MRTRKESDLQLCCDSQSSERLQKYRSFLGVGSKKPVFDNRSRDMLKSYVWDLPDMERTVTYLDGLRDPDGKPFGRSVPQPEKLQAHLDHYSKADAPDFRWNVHYRNSFRKVSERYSEARLVPERPSTDEEAWELFSRTNTSAGWTSISMGFQKKREIPRVGFLELAERKENEAISNGEFDSYYLMAHRTSASGELTDDGQFTGTCKLKDRPVWNEDAFVVWSGRRFSKPITDQFLNSYKYSSAGKDPFYTESRIINMRAIKGTYISLDYSAFDSTQPAWLLYDAFKVVEMMFVGLTERETALLHVLRDDFIHKNLITKEGVFHTDHGDPSGSSFTTIINGICNELITETWVDKFGYKDVDYTIQGDDNLIYGQVEFDKANIASYVYKNFGVMVNEEKTTVGRQKDYPEYLGYTWRNDGPYRHPRKLISKILYPERFRDYIHKPDLKPELIIYSYILGCRAGMRALMDVDKFLNDYSLTSIKFADLSEDVIQELPYVIRESISKHSQTA